MAAIMSSDEIKSLIKRISETDSRKEHEQLLEELTLSCNELIKTVDCVCREVGVEPPWMPLLAGFNLHKISFVFNVDPTVWNADTTCYGTKDVEFFTITVVDGHLENNIPIELPWFNMNNTDWRKKLISEKREALEKEIVAAQIHVKMAQERLDRFKEKFGC